MNKILLCFFTSLAIITSGCSMSDTRPHSTYSQHLKDIAIEADRSDRGAVHLTLQNNSKKDVTVNWKKSAINNEAVVINMLNDFEKEIEDTILPSREKINVVLYQKNNIFYRDPVLYQPGGYQTKEIQYPAIVDIVIDNVSNKKEVHFNEN